MLVLQIILLVFFSIILLFSAFSIVEEISVAGFKSIKTKPFAISLVALGFSMFLVLKVINGMF